jgi:HlyD family secretion protein
VFKAWRAFKTEVYESLLAAEREPDKRILGEALTFQSDLVHLLDEPLPRGLRGAIHYFGMLIFLALLISIIFKVDVVVQGQGKLTYDGPPIVLQPFEHAVLRSLSVRPGDAVKKGQVLATLDPTFSQADLSALESRNKAVRSQIRRLEAESTNTAYEPSPADGEAGILQLEVYTRRMAEHRARMRTLEETLAETRASLSRTKSDIKNLEEQLKISSTVEKMQESLLKLNTNSKLEYLSAQNNRLRAEREFQEATDRLVEGEHRLKAVESQKEGAVEEWKRVAFEELTRQRAEQAQVEASLTKITRMNALISITAPEDGVVLDIANRSVGSVLRDAEPLVILIPTSIPMISEIQLSSAAVGEASVGDKVLIKVDAFPFQRFGGLHGHIRSISFESHSGGAPGDMESVANKRAVGAGGLHRVAIELQSPRIDRQPANRSLFPGMTVTAEIHLGKRRLINYLLHPILRGLGESFREP